jgi:parvulin-like peptidyl-prolyl isomerase
MPARLLREPLVHFLGIGLLLFALYALVAPADSGGDRITISRAMVEDLKAQHGKLWGRPPTVAELQALIDRRIADEILYREGLAMGLDRDDAVIKRRVRQKYELIAEEEDSVAPTEADLAAYLKANADRFRSAPVVGFTQVMVAPEGSAREVEARAAALKAALDGGADPATAGRATLLPGRVPPMALDLVARDFGEAFAAALATAPEGAWAGPILSAYGLHLVRVDSRTPAADPALGAVRAEVQREWENERRLKARAARLAELRTRYDVVVEQ